MRLPCNGYTQMNLLLRHCTTNFTYQHMGATATCFGCFYSHPQGLLIFEDCTTYGVIAGQRTGLTSQEFRKELYQFQIVG
jgi:hypothetical protein